MTLQQRISTFAELGNKICQFLDFMEVENPKDTEYNESFFNLKEAVKNAKHHNGWFTENNIIYALNGWCNELNTNSLNKWLLKYNLKDIDPRIVAIIMAGNIPLVGFHDFISVLISGHRVLAKLSSNDKILFPALTDMLIEIEPAFKDYITFTENKLEDFDAVIATGSDNTSRYFEYYFRNKPSIIRHNRNSVAVLNGRETDEQLAKLADDVFRYYGLGCRNVSKIFVPIDYKFEALFNALFKYKDIIHEHKYANNYDYNKAVYLMSEFSILDNGYIVLKEDAAYSSPIATLFYEFYDDSSNLKQKLKNEAARIQCVVSNGFMKEEVSFGETQKPKLWDYADNVDTIAFLSEIA